MSAPKSFRTMYERLVANTVLADPDNPQSCWLWTGQVQHNGYPRIGQYVPGLGWRNRQAHRVMLEEVLGVQFPDDEAGHLCYEVRCIHPDHLEPQTPAFNKSERRGYAPVDGCMIPVLFPHEDALQASADRAWEGEGEVGGPCPF